MPQPARKSPPWRIWVLSLSLIAGFGLLSIGCSDEGTLTPASTPTRAPAPAPAPEPEPEGLAAPTGLTATGGAGSITWTWTAVAGVTSYSVEYNIGTAFEAGANSTVVDRTEFTLSNLAAAEAAYMRVRSRAGTATAPEYSDWTEAIAGAAGVPSATALDAPSDVTASDPGEDFVQISWGAVDDAATYQVRQRTEGVSWSNVDCGDGNSMSETECTATELDPETTYRFRVRAVPDPDDDSLSTSDWSDIAEATTLRSTGGAGVPSATALDAPSDVTASNPGEDSVEISWGAVDDAATYQVRQRTEGVSWSNVDCGDGNFTSETECTATELDPETTYRFRVRAVPDPDDDSISTSDWSDIVEATTLRSGG